MRIANILAALALVVFTGCDLGNAPGGGTGVDGLTGILVDERGAPVAGARVRVHPAPAALSKGPATPSPRAESTFTGMDGRYRFERLPHGRYDLRASVRIRDTAYALFIPAIRHDRFLDLKVDTVHVASTLRVRVVDGEEARPVPGATCSIAGEGAALSDAMGECVLEGLAPGEFTLRVSVPGESTIEARVTVSKGGAELFQVVVGAGGGVTPVQAPRLVFPPDDTLSVGMAQEFLWEIPSAESATYYKLQIAIDSLFAECVFDDPVGLPVSGGSYRYFHSGLDWGTRYYWRVISVSAGFSLVSETRTFTTRSQPAAPSDLGWTVRRDVAGESYGRLAYSGYMLVVPVNVDGGSYLLTSTDGVTWTKRAEGLADKINDAAWTGDRFLAVGSKGVLLTSSDGLAWSKRTLDSTVDLETIAHYPVELAVIGGGSYTFVSTSADTGTWTRHAQSARFRKIVGDRSVFIAITDAGIQRSLDGVTWTRPDLQTAETLRDAAWAKAVVVAVGDNGIIRTSSDGLTWASPVSETTEDLDRIIWDEFSGTDGMWHAGPVQSTNGAAWTKRDTKAPSILTQAYFNSTLVGLDGKRIYTKELN